MRIRDWSSDVCSSDLGVIGQDESPLPPPRGSSQCNPDAGVQCPRRERGRCYTWAPRTRIPALSPALPPLREIDDASRSLGLGMDAPELHGALCGWLAGGGGDGPDWLGKLLVDAELPAIVEGSALDRMAKASAAQLEDQSFEFALLLPDDDAGLAERSGALFEWCRGFLGAFGLARSEGHT